ncbi:non-specific serine/threonine protein kinase [Balamuthia mandrillaris]
MAPEVILGEDYDNKCDVYGFGVVLYELISRTKPPKRGPQTCFDFKEDDIAAIIPPDCPPKFSDLANNCCKYFSKDRPSFAEVLEKLKEIVEECKDDVGTASSAIVIPNNDEEDKKKEERKKSSRKKKKKEVKSPTSRSPKSPTISSASERTTEKGEEEEVMGEMEVTSSGKLKPLVFAKKKPKKESAGRRDSKGKPRKSQPSPSIPASTSGTDLQGDAKKEVKKEHRRSWLVSAKLPGVSKASRGKSPRKATENEDGSYSPSSSSPSASLTRDTRQGTEQDHQLSPKPRKDKDTTTNLDESNEQAPHGEEGMTEEEAEFEQTPESLPVVRTSTLSEGNVTKESVEVSKKVYRSKKITMKLTKDVRAFSPGEAVLINVAVDNQTNKTISMITVQLERINYVSIEGKSKNKTLEKTKTETVTVGKPVNYFYTIGPSAKYDGSVEYLLPKDLTSSARGENETVSYSLIVTCVVKHAKDISTIFPIEVK